MGGVDPNRPRTRSTSCGIPSWNVPKLIFGEGEKEKVSPKIVSPNKEAVFFLINIFFSKWNMQKVSPNWDGSKSVTKSIARSSDR